jgi:hypothetical protein
VLEGVYLTFVRKAVPRFNKIYRSGSRDQSLRYTWPLFLKHGGGSDDFWSKLRTWIFSRLRTEAVLESRHHGKLVPPESLFYIPEQYRQSGDPLVEDRSCRHHHLSFLYDTEIGNTLRYLQSMGLKVLDFPEFFKEFKDIITKPGDSFLSAQTKEWHSQVASLFLRYGNTRHVANIPIIPLRDGSWVTPSHRHLFLEGEASSAKVPSGLDICIVDPEASQDKNRQKFFAWVGIKTCGQAEVCQMIVDSYYPFRARTLTNSVQDLIYLFKMSQSSQSGKNTSFKYIRAHSTQIHSSGFIYAKSLYIQHPDKESVVDKYAENPAASMPILDPAYIEAARVLGKAMGFVSWACSELNMSLLPLLIDEQQLLSA